MLSSYRHLGPSGGPSSCVASCAKDVVYDLLVDELRSDDTIEVALPRVGALAAALESAAVDTFDSVAALATFVFVLRALVVVVEVAMAPQGSSVQKPSVVRQQLDILAGLGPKRPIALALKFGKIGTHIISAASVVVKVSAKDTASIGMLSDGIGKLTSTIGKRGFSLEQGDFEKGVSIVLSAIKGMSSQALEGELDRIGELWAALVDTLSSEQDHILGDTEDDIVVMIEGMLAQAGEIALVFGATSDSPNDNKAIALPKEEVRQLGERAASFFGGVKCDLYELLGRIKTAQTFAVQVNDALEAASLNAVATEPMSELQSLVDMRASLAGHLKQVLLSMQCFTEEYRKDYAQVLAEWSDEAPGQGPSFLHMLLEGAQSLNFIKADLVASSLQKPGAATLRAVSWKVSASSLSTMFATLAEGFVNEALQACSGCSLAKGCMPQAPGAIQDLWNTKQPHLALGLMLHREVLPNWPAFTAWVDREVAKFAGEKLSCIEWPHEAAALAADEFVGLLADGQAC